MQCAAPDIAAQQLLQMRKLIPLLTGSGQSRKVEIAQLPCAAA
jgi:hypothetical protein